MGDFAFGEFGQREVTAVACEKRDDVGVDVEAGAFRGDIVRYDQVGVLLVKFFARVFRDAIGFGGKADDQAIALLARAWSQGCRCSVRAAA